MVDQGEDAPDTTSRRSVVPALLLVTGVGLLAVLLVQTWWQSVGCGRQPWITMILSMVIGFGGLVLLFVLLDVGARRLPSREPEAWLCTHCLKPYVPGAHFCPRCASPLTVFAATAPYESIFARAWCLGKVAHHPSRCLHVIGMAIIGLPIVLGVLAGFVLVAWDLLAGDPVGVVGVFLGTDPIIVVLAYLYGALLVYCVRNDLRRRREEPYRRPEIAYGAPPWWTWDPDRELPEFESGESGEETGAGASGDPPGGATDEEV